MFLSKASARLVKVRHTQLDASDMELLSWYERDNGAYCTNNAPLQDGNALQLNHEVQDLDQGRC